MAVQPFDNTVDKVVMTGEGIKNSLEAAAASIDFNNPDGYPGFGYQVAGVRFNISVGPDNVNNRIRNLQVKNMDGGYNIIDPQQVMISLQNNDFSTPYFRIILSCYQVFWLVEEVERIRNR